VNKDDTHPVSDIPSAGTLDRKTQEEHWIIVQPRNSNVQASERPSGVKKLKFRTSASAHKSDKAKDATAVEIAQGIFSLAHPNFNPTTKTFHDAPVQVIEDQEQDPKAIKGFKKATMDGLLKAAGITPARWFKWWEKAGGQLVESEENEPTWTEPDTTKLLNAIKEHVKG
jgi:hypothetical protein